MRFRWLVLALIPFLNFCSSSDNAPLPSADQVAQLVQKEDIKMCDIYSDYMCQICGQKTAMCLAARRKTEHCRKNPDSCRIGYCGKRIDKVRELPLDQQKRVFACP